MGYPLRDEQISSSLLQPKGTFPYTGYRLGKLQLTQFRGAVAHVEEPAYVNVSAQKISLDTPLKGESHFSNLGGHTSTDGDTRQMLRIAASSIPDSYNPLIALMRIKSQIEVSRHTADGIEVVRGHAAQHTAITIEKDLGCLYSLFKTEGRIDKTSAAYMYAYLCSIPAERLPSELSIIKGWLEDRYYPYANPMSPNSGVKTLSDGLGEGNAQFVHFCITHCGASASELDAQIVNDLQLEPDDQLGVNLKAYLQFKNIYIKDVNILRRALIYAMISDKPMDISAIIKQAKTCGVSEALLGNEDVSARLDETTRNELGINDKSFSGKLNIISLAVLTGVNQELLALCCSAALKAEKSAQIEAYKVAFDNNLDNACKALTPFVSAKIVKNKVPIAVADRVLRLDNSLSVKEIWVPSMQFFHKCRDTLFGIKGLQCKVTITRTDVDRQYKIQHSYLAKKNGKESPQRPFFIKNVDSIQAAKTLCEDAFKQYGIQSSFAPNEANERYKTYAISFLENRHSPVWVNAYDFETKDNFSEGTIKARSSSFLESAILVHQQKNRKLDQSYIARAGENGLTSMGKEKRKKEAATKLEDQRVTRTPERIDVNLTVPPFADLPSKPKSIAGITITDGFDATTTGTIRGQADEKVVFTYDQNTDKLIFGPNNTTVQNGGSLEDALAEGWKQYLVLQQQKARRATKRRSSKVVAWEDISDIFGPEDKVKNAWYHPENNNFIVKIDGKTDLRGSLKEVHGGSKELAEEGFYQAVDYDVTFDDTKPTRRVTAATPKYALKITLPEELEERRALEDQPTRVVRRQSVSTTTKVFSTTEFQKKCPNVNEVTVTRPHTLKTIFTVSFQDEASEIIIEVEKNQSGNPLNYTCTQKLYSDSTGKNPLGYGNSLDLALACFDALPATRKKEAYGFGSLLESTAVDHHRSDGSTSSRERDEEQFGRWE